MQQGACFLQLESKSQRGCLHWTKMSFGNKNNQTARPPSSQYDPVLADSVRPCFLPSSYLQLISCASCYYTDAWIHISMQWCVTFLQEVLLWKVVSGKSLEHFSSQLFYCMLQGLCSFHFCTAINAVVYFQCAISHLRPETDKGHLNSLVLIN